VKYGAMLAVVASLLGGCAAIPWPQTAWSPAGEASQTGWLDLRGAVHVHTDASHDSPGTLEAVVAAARSAGLRWVALTEHTDPGQLGPLGEIDGITVLPGFEASTAGGSLLAIGVDQSPPRSKDAAELVRWTHAAGGVAYVGHFERSRLAEPEAWRAAAPDGVELLNLHANAELRRGSLAWRIPLLPGSIALRTLAFLPADNLARWDALPGPPPIVGGVDAHAKFRLLGALGGTVDRYRDIFRLVTTHVRARDTSPASILDALRSGRSYVAIEARGRVDAFRFERTPAGYQLAAPQKARLSLYCDGQRVATRKAQSAVLTPPAGATACRAEARLDGRPWIVSSPDVLPIPES
jgi:hypothetical protein